MNKPKAYKITEERLRIFAVYAGEIGCRQSRSLSEEEYVEAQNDLEDYIQALLYGGKE